MSLVDTEPYEIFDHIHPDIPEGGQRLGVPYEATTGEILCTLIEPNFEIKHGTSGNTLSLTCKRCSLPESVPGKVTY